MKPMWSQPIEDIEQDVAWPTVERFAFAKRAVTDLYNELEALEFSYRVLNGEYDPADVARVSPPVSAEVIADTVTFAFETEVELEQINRIAQLIRRWPAALAHVRCEQAVQARDGQPA